MSTQQVGSLTLRSSRLDSAGLIRPTACFYIFKWLEEKKREGEEDYNMEQIFEIQVLVSINKVLLEYSPFIYILFMVAFML